MDMTVYVYDDSILPSSRQETAIDPQQTDMEPNEKLVARGRRRRRGNSPAHLRVSRRNPRDFLLQFLESHSDSWRKIVQR